MSMAASIDGQFDELHDIMMGFSGSRGDGVPAQPGGILPLLDLGPAVADSAGPRRDHVLLYQFQPRSGTGEAQGNQVSPGGHLRGPAE
jgi:hypothetical protein